MNLRAPIQYSCNPNHHPRSRKFVRKYIVPEPTVRLLKLKINRGFISNCASPSHGVTGNSDRVLSVEEGKEETIAVVEKAPSAEDDSENKKEELSEKEGLWGQMVEIAKFSGPAVGLWVCGPLMSLIDTAVIGQGSSIELAALGPGTVFCDNTSYVFMFLSIATSNLVATSLARQDKDEVQHQISVLLFIGLVSGFLMLFFTRCYGTWALTAFTGASNVEIITAANTYVQIRGLAWPAVLIGWVAQSASLGMKDSWGPLNALAVEAERAYHQHVLQILDQLEGEMISERQRIEAAPAPAPSVSVDTMPAPPPPSYEELNGVSTSPMQNGLTDSMGYFLGEVLYTYQAESDVELNLSVGDYVVVRKVSNNGWAEGECKGKAGWFPFGYIERRDRVLASKVAAEVF
ncbi:MATE efflux family protein 4- chloroplastic [Striga hermonthica]|uniref:MATE efflux family protein 4- chloroplastic n=1 Tax=Striga hermonthica TaxID=68872 RepID=A0A9N7RFE0_STRHE|nr:MATE efflux family protein 4- chloroplastic [Striga hermonthica]